MLNFRSTNCYPLTLLTSIETQPWHVCYDFDSFYHTIPPINNTCLKIMKSRTSKHIRLQSGAGIHRDRACKHLHRASWKWHIFLEKFYNVSDIYFLRNSTMFETNENSPSGWNGPLRHKRYLEEVPISIKIGGIHTKIEKAPPGTLPYQNSKDTWYLLILYQNRKGT